MYMCLCVCVCVCLGLRNDVSLQMYDKQWTDVGFQWWWASIWSSIRFQLSGRASQGHKWGDAYAQRGCTIINWQLVACNIVAPCKILHHSRFYWYFTVQVSTFCNAQNHIYKTTETGCHSFQTFKENFLVQRDRRLAMCPYANWRIQWHATFVLGWNDLWLVCEQLTLHVFLSSLILLMILLLCQGFQSRRGAWILALCHPFSRCFSRLLYNILASRGGFNSQWRFQPL